MFNLLEDWFLGRLNIVEHDAVVEHDFSLIWEYLLGEILSWTWEKFLLRIITLRRKDS